MGEVAYLTESGSATIEQIDDRKVGFAKGEIRRARRYELLPGAHWIAVSYWSQSANMTYRSTRNIIVYLPVKGRGRYQVEAWTRDGKWLPLVRDLATDKVVAGPVPKAGTRSETK
jgi:hypothetical protein